MDAIGKPIWFVATNIENGNLAGRGKATRSNLLKERARFDDIDVI